MKRLLNAELRIAKRIADRNARFLKATPAMQRVMVAQDVIEAIDAGEINITVRPLTDIE